MNENERYALDLDLASQSQSHAYITHILLFQSFQFPRTRYTIFSFPLYHYKQKNIFILIHFFRRILQFCFIFILIPLKSAIFFVCEQSVL